MSAQEIQRLFEEAKCFGCFSTASMEELLRLALLSRIHGTSTAYRVATLPAAGTAGRRAFVTDATSTTFASIPVGGGANVVPVFDNGTNWIIA